MIPSLVFAGDQAGRAGHCVNQRRIRGQCTRCSGDLSFSQEHRSSASSCLYFRWYHANSPCFVLLKWYLYQSMLRHIVVSLFVLTCAYGKKFGQNRSAESELFWRGRTVWEFPFLIPFRELRSLVFPPIQLRAIHLCRICPQSCDCRLHSEVRWLLWVVCFQISQCIRFFVSLDSHVAWGPAYAHVPDTHCLLTTEEGPLRGRGCITA